MRSISFVQALRVNGSGSKCIFFLSVQTISVHNNTLHPISAQTPKSRFGRGAPGPNNSAANNAWASKSACRCVSHRRPHCRGQLCQLDSTSEDAELYALGYAAAVCSVRSVISPPFPSHKLCDPYDRRLWPGHGPQAINQGRPVHLSPAANTHHDTLCTAAGVSGCITQWRRGPGFSRA